MRSDYANSKPRKKPPQRKKAPQAGNPPPANPKISPLMLVLGLAVIAAFGYGLWFLKHDDSGNDTIKPQVKKTAPVTVTAPVHHADKNALPPKPKEVWVYPDELKNKQVEVDVPKRKQATRPYQMQCGSFRTDAQAQELKARIAFTGLEAQVRKVKGSSGYWYKVVLGPFDHKRQAERNRHTLQRSGINGCMIWFWQG